MVNRFLFSIILMFSLAGYSSAQSAAITSGIDWLIANQNTDKSWGGVSSSVTPFNTTAATVSALKICGNTGSAAVDGLSWLNGQTSDSVNFAADRLLANAITGLSTTADLNFIVSLKNFDGSWGLDGEYANDISEIALTLQALYTANYSDYATLFQAINFLISTQNSDGGWGSTAGEASNAYVTAHVLKALNVYSSVFINQNTINKASSYLFTKQNTDGGFGSSPSNVYETALSVLSLIESSTGSIPTIQSGIQYLTSTQSTDGSWNQDPYSTALALQALASARANLTVSSISFTNPMPQEGTETTITAMVKNIGYEDTANVVVRFFLGDPAAAGVQIGPDQLIPQLSVNASAQVSVTQSFTGTGGKTIFVKVDPDNIVSETNETDNLATARIWIATAPDLAVFSEDLKPSTYVPSSGTAFTLEYTVRNLGESSTEGFDIAVYDAQPSGTALQTAHISGLGGAEVRTGSVGVTLTGNGSHTLYLVADTGNAITELSKTNNTGSVTIQVGGVQKYADLAVTSSDITLTPARPRAGDTVQITARVRNQGMEPAAFVTIEIYDGSPESNGTLIASQTVTIIPGTDQVLTANWTINPGIHDIYVIADRLNQINETNETNNRASVRVMPDMVDITLSATDLVFTPSHPVNGDSVLLSVTVHNSGIKDTGTFNLAIYDGDPAVGGALLQTFSIANIPGDGSTTVSHLFTAIPWTYRFYAVADTENAVVELYETNNQAIRSLKIKAPGETLGPDLVPVENDLSGTTTDARTLAINGDVKAIFQGTGNDKVLIIKDTDRDNRYTTGTDDLLATGIKTSADFGDEPALGTILMITRESSPDMNLDGRIYLFEHDGSIEWGPVYLRQYDLENPHTPYENVTITSDTDNEGQPEISIRVKDKNVTLDRDGYRKQPQAGNSS